MVSNLSTFNALVVEEINEVPSVPNSLTTLSATVYIYLIHLMAAKIMAMDYKGGLRVNSWTFSVTVGSTTHGQTASQSAWDE